MVFSLAWIQLGIIRLPFDNVMMLQKQIMRTSFCQNKDEQVFKLWVGSASGPWLVHFFRSGKNPHDPNPQHLRYNQKCISRGIPSLM